MTVAPATPRQNFLAIPRANFRYPFPSPLQKLERLTKELGGAQVWAKRDDTNSPLAAGGGNKVRKLEYLVQDALDKGCETLVSIGGIQSNHTRAVGSVAVAAGLKCVTVQEDWVPGQQDNPVYDKVGNIQLNRLMGTDVRLVDAGFDIAHRPSLKAVFEEVEKKGGKPYYIPAGASDHELGAMGFTGFMLELEEQEKELGIHFDTIIVCSVTGSSQAGIIVGSAIQKDEGKPARRVIGIDASAKPAQTKAQVRKIAQATADKLGLGRELTEEEVELDERFHAGVYGLADEETLEAMKLGARTDGMVTDPVYEGKSLAGLIKLVRDGEISKESNVLYVHLGGQAALSAYPDLIK